jgi:superfamily I DNA and RNA helicase
LISQFYRDDSDSPPEWDNLHVIHSWGGKWRQGVYYDLCKMYNSAPLIFRDAVKIDSKIPFRACCREVLKLNIKPIYDYILVDEAQDFPNEYFQLLLKLAGPEKRIYWAYDQLQSLSAIKIPSITERFGVDANGKPLITLEGDDYPGGIEKDLVLPSSYRCPQKVLMLAHGIGLGIHSPTGCAQMLDDKVSWSAIGYEIKHGNLQKGENTVIFRPQENSPNRIAEIYTGNQSIISAIEFSQREDELEWVVNSIHKDVTDEKVRPEDIIIISLDSRHAKEYFTNIQSKLLLKNIRSTIPGLIDESYEFAEPNCITLSTVHRAKGNEAPVVYIISFDWLYDYIEEVENRNKAFTSISRSKGWVRITGSGKQMQEVKKEIDKVLNDIPYFKFDFPDMEEIPRLDAYETNRRKNEVKKAKDSINKLIGTDKKALSALDPEVIKKLKEMIEDIADEDK